MRESLNETAPDVSPGGQIPPQSLRIAHVLDAPFAVEDANGVSRAVRYLATAQAEKGHAVAVFSGVNGAHLVGQAVHAERTVRRRPPSWASVRARMFSRCLNSGQAKEVFDWTPDLVHFHSVHVLRHVALAACVSDAGVPYCVTVHGGLFPLALQRGRVRKAMFNLLVERRFFREASFVHAVNPREVTAIRRYGFDGRIVVVPNAIAPEMERVTDPQAVYTAFPNLRNRRIFMFIGRLDAWQKGLDLLIDAFAQGNPEGAALVLVGPDDRGSQRSLELRAERRGVRPKVVFAGPVFGPQRANLLAGADVFVHPSRWEGLALSVLGAAAAGKPCLLTRDADPLGALERAEAAVVVEATVGSIAAGLTRLALMNESELRDLGRRARAVPAAHLTWPAAADSLLAAYHDAMAAPRRHAEGLRDG